MAICCWILCTLYTLSSWVVPVVQWRGNHYYSHFADEESEACEVKWHTKCHLVAQWRDSNPDLSGSHEFLLPCGIGGHLAKLTSWKNCDSGNEGRSSHLSTEMMAGTAIGECEFSLKGSQVSFSRCLGFCVQSFALWSMNKMTLTCKISVFLFLPSYIFYFILFFYSCFTVNFCCTAKWLSFIYIYICMWMYIHIYILFLILSSIMFCHKWLDIVSYAVQ